MPRPGLIASNVRDDGLGPICADCLGLVYADRIEVRGRGARVRFRHMEQHPACFGPRGASYSRLIASAS